METNSIYGGGSALDIGGNNGSNNYNNGHANLLR
jgi:hypothetical protein